MMHFVSGSCRGERCSVCLRQKMLVDATHKIGEEIPHDDPNRGRHELTAYVCCDHYAMIMGPSAPCVIGNMTPKCPLCGGMAAEGGFTGDSTVEQACDKCGHTWRAFIPS